MEKKKGTVLGDTLLTVLEEKIKALESENALLKQREKVLQNELAIARNGLKDIDVLRERYENGINGITELKETYNKLIREAALAQKKFEKDSVKLIHSMNKR